MKIVLCGILSDGEIQRMGLAMALGSTTGVLGILVLRDEVGVSQRCPYDENAARGKARRHVFVVEYCDPRMTCHITCNEICAVKWANPNDALLPA